MGRYKDPNCFSWFPSKKSIEGLERSGKGSSSRPRSTSEEAGCSDIKMHAGPCSRPGTSESSSCLNVLKGSGNAKDA